MIIRLTVEDNDFGILMDTFVKHLSSRITKLPSNIESLDGKKQFEICKEIKIIDRLLNPNVTENHTEEEKEILIKRIKEAFYEFVNYRTEDSTAEYLVKNFKVEIINSMEDKWENGEVWYWFQHSGVWLNQ